MIWWYDSLILILLLIIIPLNIVQGQIRMQRPMLRFHIQVQLIHHDIISASYHYHHYVIIIYQPSLIIIIISQHHDMIPHPPQHHHPGYHCPGPNATGDVEKPHSGTPSLSYPPHIHHDIISIILIIFAPTWWSSEEVSSYYQDYKAEDPKDTEDPHGKGSNVNRLSLLLSLLLLLL